MRNIIRFFILVAVLSFLVTGCAQAPLTDNTSPRTIKKERKSTDNSNDRESNKKDDERENND